MKPLEQIPFNPERWPFFYGWMILFWGTLGVLLSVPGQTTGVSAFIEPLIRDLGVSRSSLSYAYLIGTLSSSFLLTPFGKVYDKIGARWMAFLSCSVLGFILLLLSQTDKITAFLGGLFPEHIAAFSLLAVLFFMLRLSGQGVLTMASRNMVMNWFDRRRGLVSGISGSAVSFGFSYTPKFFSGLIEARGWSGTWFLLGVLLILFFAPLLFLFFRDRPETSGLVPDGKTAGETGKLKAGNTRPFTLAEARGTFCFWAFALTMALQALVITAVTFHIESIFEQAGMEGKQGFNIFIPMSAVAITVTLIGGWIADRTQLRWLLATMLGGMAGNLFCISFIHPGWPIIGMILFGGIANGLFGLLMSVTWPRYFGREHLGAISGLCMTLMVVFSAIGPAFYSRVLDLFGSYFFAHLLCLFCAVLLCVAAFFARNPQQNR